jgi:hypothetical protein
MLGKKFDVQQDGFHRGHSKHKGDLGQEVSAFCNSSFTGHPITITIAIAIAPMFP